MPFKATRFGQRFRRRRATGSMLFRRRYGRYRRGFRSRRVRSAFRRRTVGHSRFTRRPFRSHSRRFARKRIGTSLRFRGPSGYKTSHVRFNRSQRKFPHVSSRFRKTLQRALGLKYVYNQVFVNVVNQDPTGTLLGQFSPFTIATPLQVNSILGAVLATAPGANAVGTPSSVNDLFYFTYAFELICSNPGNIPISCQYFIIDCKYDLPYTFSSGNSSYANDFLLSTYSVTGGAAPTGWSANTATNASRYMKFWEQPGYLNTMYKKSPTVNVVIAPGCKSTIRMNRRRILNSYDMSLKVGSGTCKYLSGLTSVLCIKFAGLETVINSGLSPISNPGPSAITTTGNTRYTVTYWPYSSPKYLYADLQDSVIPVTTPGPSWVNAMGQPLNPVTVASTAAPGSTTTKIQL